MKRLFLVGILFSMYSGLFAQKLSVESVDVEKNSMVEIILVNEVEDDAVALQLNLVLPKKFAVDEASISKGGSFVNHDLEWRCVNDNSYLFVCYSPSNAMLSDGELLRIPVNVGEQEGAFACEVQSIRSSNVESVGKDAEALTFNINVFDPTGLSDIPVDGQKGLGVLYDLQGREVQQSQPAKHTIYILNGKKILMK